MEIRKLRNVAVLTTSEGMSLSRGGRVPAKPESRVSVPLADIEHWGEIPVQSVTEAAEEAKRMEAYKARVEELIAERYSLRDELAIHRQRDTKPQEFAAYNAFAESCKARARMELDKS